MIAYDKPFPTIQPPYVSAGTILSSQTGTITRFPPEAVMKAAYEIIQAALDGASTDKFVTGPQVALAKWVIELR